jgi:DNA-directed RNA polymerase specialized sigma24 family protein
VRHLNSRRLLVEAAGSGWSAASFVSCLHLLSLYDWHMAVQNQGRPSGFGGSELFPTTLWGDIHSARGRSQPALARLCERYREPLFVYLQRRGLDYYAASDVVQGFFAHLLEREFLAGLEPGKGRFRAFLVQSIQNYLSDQEARAAAWKRGGRAPHVPLTGQIADWTREGMSGSRSVAPDKAYERAWAQTVLRNALASWRAEQAGQRNGAALQTEAVEQMMYCDGEAPSYFEVSLRLGVAPGTLKMRAYRLRLRLAFWIREEIRQTLASGDDVEEELRHLIRVLRE